MPWLAVARMAAPYKTILFDSIAKERRMDFEDVGEIRVKIPARAILANRKDNVAVVLGEVKVGEEVRLAVNWHEIARTNIPPGHKMAINIVEAGQPVIKFGQVIGVAKSRIQPGEHVHVHNLLAS